ncbi:MAG: LysR family transcriptional regulator [Butyrivibrio sp.]|uniref:LysR family transcriptional regulator n=1 Tax=Butyrivibrio sp. TaxID=28121 RepID=UPI0025DC2BFC|nr:LysR family transcriptional regulator [Butyrivibrio sp.]MCR5772696.1 LysR family transcriptional regulator [Butyrivibrio sp.]
MIENHVLKQLVTFADNKTLSATADILHTSQPALTRSMKKLEEDLGVSLFSRSKNHLELNETGKHAAEYARRVLEAEADFESKVLSFDRSLHTLSIGYCAPVPQAVFTPMINNLFNGMTISADMMDDRSFTDHLLNGIYQLAVVHTEPDDKRLYYKKCGHEDLFISIRPGDPLAFQPKIHLSDINGMSVLLLSRIGFWENTPREKTPDTKYLLQVDEASFIELASTSNYPIFSSSYFIKRGNLVQGRVDIPLADPECHTDYYLVCLDSEKEKYRALFDKIDENTIL